ncbi:hypothetical protein BJX63DRAFT_403360 [Aspergillus granulosus]|uniref:Uncharacterized protein n=1 Tax=Aspergillus granulosus TaxID=176169 RepID=A0ABR4H3K8_9EURO
MKLAALLAVFSLGLTALAEPMPLQPGPAPELADAAPVERSLDVDLEKRQCTASRCRCNMVRGQFCGNTAVNRYCLDTHVYECNPSGATCDYGYRKSCAQCGRLSC